jgi:hypothetical protein
MRTPQITQFDYVKIGIASPERIRQWGERTLPNGQTVGEVTKPETINYRTLKQKWMAYFVNGFLARLKIGNVIAVSIRELDIAVLFANAAEWK